MVQWHEEIKKQLDASGSLTKYKYSIIKENKIQKDIDKYETKYENDKMQKYQNTNMTKCKMREYKLDKIRSNKIKMQQNTNVPKYKCNKI